MILGLSILSAHPVCVLNQSSQRVILIVQHWWMSGGLQRGIQGGYSGCGELTVSAPALEGFPKAHLITAAIFWMYNESEVQQAHFLP
jgi:hypothetical protein